MNAQAEQVGYRQLPERDWYTIDEVAHLIGIKKHTLANWRWEGRRGPPFRKVGLTIQYPKQAFVAWRDSQPVVSSTSELAAPAGK